MRFSEGSKKRTLIAGTGGNCLSETIERTEKAAELNYDAAMVIPPYYYKPKMSDDALFNYYTQLAKSVSIPIILYNIPQFTGINFSVLTVKVIILTENRFL